VDLMAELLDDLRGETAALDDLLSPLRPDDWELATPADGWLVRDQVSHLAWFDDAARNAVTHPAEFRVSAAHLTSVDDLAVQARGLPVAELHEWFRTARARSIEEFARLGPKDRLPWYGPDMSAASFVTARLMETWAHGHDIADALGVTRRPTARLRHVAMIGYRAFPYGFAVRNLAVPRTPVRVELETPGGEPWAAGPEGAPDVVRGPMLDFCLAVTQRVHLSDTTLEITGETARAWMDVAQAFAGPPGKGRAPRSGKRQGHSG
jgi:uncharacterized protein (TIGR03084 family)